MITISGLTEQQLKMLTYMWSINSEEELTEWQYTLDNDALRESFLLRHLVTLAVLDQDIDQLTQFPDAEIVLNKFQIQP